MKNSQEKKSLLTLKKKAVSSRMLTNGVRNSDKVAFTTVSETDVIRIF